MWRTTFMIIYQHLTLLCFYCHISFYNVVFSVLSFCVNNIDDKYTNVTRQTHTVPKQRLNNEQGHFFLKNMHLCGLGFEIVWKEFYLIRYQPPLSLRIVYHDDICSFYNRNTCFSFFLYFSLIVSFVFVSYKNRQNGLQLQSSLQNNLPENLYNSAHPWFLSSLISLRYIAHTNEE